MTKPIAYITGYHNGYPVVQPTDGAAVLRTGMSLYDHPAPDVQPVAWIKKDRSSIEVSIMSSEYMVNLGFEPLYAHPPANDVAELVEALRRLEEVASDCDIGYMDNALRHARVVLDKWEGK